jgi:hypothetical protein
VKFHFIDLENLQKYFDDAGLDHVAPVAFEGSFCEVAGNCYNFVKKIPCTFNIRLLRDDTYALTINNKERVNLKYDEDNRCKMERV